MNSSSKLHKILQFSIAIATKIVTQHKNLALVGVFVFFALIFFSGAIALPGTQVNKAEAAISLKAAGSWSTCTADCSPSIPGSPAVGDRMFLFTSWKDYSITASVSGWTPIGTEFADGTTGQASGTGSVKVMAWYRDYTGSGDAPTIDYSSSPNLAGAVVMLWQKDSSEIWDDPTTVTAAISSATSWTATASSTVTIPSGGVVMGHMGFRDDSATMTRSTSAITNSGGSVTWNGNYVESPATHFSTTSANDGSADLGYRLVTTGDSGITLQSTGTLSASETGSARWVVQGVSPFTISGICKQYDQTTDCVDDGSNSIKVAINGVLSGQTDTTVDGAWSISGVTLASGDNVIVFIDTPASANKKATAITKYDGSGQLDGLVLYEEHVTIGTSGGGNSGQTFDSTVFDDYDYSDDTDVFYFWNSTSSGCPVYTYSPDSAFCVDQGADSSQERLIIFSGNTVSSSDSIMTHDFVNNGTISMTSESGDYLVVNGSLTNTGSIDMASDLLWLNSTTTGETITSGGVYWNNVYFSSASGGWTLQDDFEMGSLNLRSGTLNGGTGTTITINTGVTVDGGSFVPGTSTVIYTQEYSSNAPAELNYYNLTFAPDSIYTTYTMGGEIGNAKSNIGESGAVGPMTIDTTNNVLYAGTTSGGNVYRCAISTGCDDSSDWALSYDSADSGINSLVFAPASGLLFAGGSGGNADIYRCAVSTGCDQQGDWSVSYATPYYGIETLVVDTTNNVLYAGTQSDGRIIRCTLSNNCDTSGDWTTSYNVSQGAILTMIFEPDAGVLYAGTTNYSGADYIYRCPVSSACDTSGDWTATISSTDSAIVYLTKDTDADVLYAWIGGVGTVHRCPLSTSCDASGDWTSITGVVAGGALTYDPSTQAIYNGVYWCKTSTDCDASGDFVYQGGILGQTNGSAYDSVNGNMYIAQNSGIVQKIRKPTYNVANDFVLGTNANTQGSYAQINIGGDFTDNGGSGSFTGQNSTVTFNDNTQTSNLRGAFTFNNLTISTSGKDLTFYAGETYTVNGLMTVTGATGAGNDVTFTSSTGSSTWTINHQGTESITYLTVSWGACHGSSTDITMGVGSSKDGNSGACWIPPLSISGVIYESDETTEDNTTRTVKISINGGTAQSMSAINGDFSFSPLSNPSAGDIITIWIDGSLLATTVLNYGTSCTGSPSCTGIKLIKDSLNLVQYHNSAITGANLTGCTNTAGTGCTDADIGFAFTVNGANDVFTTTLPTVIVSTGTTFNPSGIEQLNYKGLRIKGTYLHAGSANLANDLLLANGSTFTKGSGSLIFSGATTQTITDSNSTKQDLGSIEMSNSVNMGSSLKMTSLLLDNGTFSANGSNTLTFTGNGSSVFSVVDGVFAASTGTVAFEPAATTGVTVPGLEYYALILNKAENTFTATEAITAVGYLQISAGTFEAPASTLTTAAFYNSGTFDHNDGTLVLVPVPSDSNNGVVIENSVTTTFNNISVTTPGTKLYVLEGTAIVVDGELTATGANGQPIAIQSLSPGDQFTITFNSQASLNYVTVRDGACSGGITLTRSLRLINLGNNGTCWGFTVLIGDAPSGGGGGSSSNSGNCQSNCAGGGSSQIQATATANRSGGSIASVTINNAGSGYTQAPAICFQDATGSGATATATLEGGAVGSITVTAPGANYSGAVTVGIAVPPGTAGAGCSSGSGQGGGGGGGASP